MSGLLSRSAAPDDTGVSLTTAQKRRSLQPGERSSIADAYADLTDTRSRRESASASERGGDMNGMKGGYDNSSKHRTQYYEEQFQYKDNSVSATRERVQKDSPVVAELKTNVIIKDEFTLVTDLSYHLAARYTRPDSSIMISVEHSACLALAGTFEPCYVLTISTLPSQMQPTTNKRNAALIQSFMADVLSVPPERGILKFVPIPEENLAMNGNTMLGEIERIEKHQGDDRKGGLREAFAGGRKSMHQKKSQPERDPIVSKPTTNGPTTTTGKRLSQQMQQKRNSSYLDAPRSNSPIIFELPATEHSSSTPAPDRPSTSHGTTPTYAAANGLRLNGISKEDLLADSSSSTHTLPNGRPKTIGSNPEPPQRSNSSRSAGVSARSRTPEPMPPPPLNVSKTPPTPSGAAVTSRYSTMPTSSSTNTTTPKPPITSSNSASENRKYNIPISPNPISNPTPIYSSTATSSDHRPTSAMSRRTSAHSTAAAPPKRQHADMPSSKPASAAAAAMAAKEKERISASGRDPTANTAKRRSTITATPKLPASGGGSGSGRGGSGAPPPPPIPESRTPKVSKRKSFLSAFRR